MRPALVRGGELDWRTVPRRILPGAESATGTLPEWVTDTAPLTKAQWNVAQAYWLLIGRAPDRGGLNFWVSQFSPTVTLAAAIDGIASLLVGMQALDPAPVAVVQMVYWVCFGKTFEDDPSGETFWRKAMEISGKTIGEISSEIFSISLSVGGWHGDTLRNRLRILEAATRAQIHYSYDISIQDSRSIVMRVEGALSSYQDALNDLYRLVVLKNQSPAISWSKTYSTSSFLAECRFRENSVQLQHRRLVWYNREREMMLAYAVLPAESSSEFNSKSNLPVICLWHGGGWRMGHPAQVYWYAQEIAANSNCIVLVPTYRLSAYGWKSPLPEQDVADFLALVRGSSSSFLKRDSTKVGLMGESAGGHLACLVGSQQDVWKVFALYPPIDLTKSISPALDDPYVLSYSEPEQRAAASPNLVWTPDRTTLFELWHGNADGFVPSNQTAALKAVVGNNLTATYKDGQGHGFTQDVRTEAVAAAVAFFAS